MLAEKLDARVLYPQPAQSSLPRHELVVHRVANSVACHAVEACTMMSWRTEVLFCLHVRCLIAVLIGLPEQEPHRLPCQPGSRGSVDWTFGPSRQQAAAPAVQQLQQQQHSSCSSNSTAAAAAISRHSALAMPAVFGSKSDGNRAGQVWCGPCWGQ